MSRKDGERLSRAIPDLLDGSKWGQLLSMPGFCLKHSPGICSRKRTLQSDTETHCEVPQGGNPEFCPSCKRGNRHLQLQFFSKVCCSHVRLNFACLG